MKKFIVIMIVLVVLLGGAGFAYAYFMTDLFRSTDELFVKYFSQTADLIANNVEDDFFDVYQDKKEQSPYINGGKISFRTITEDDAQTEDYVITFDGQTDKLSDKTEQNISINYGEDAKFDFMYRNVQDIYALQSNSVSEKFIAVDNNNLQEFMQKFGTGDVSNIPNKLEVKNVEFTEEERNALKETYVNIIKENLTAENFSKISEGGSKAYTLTLTEEQVENILTQILEKAKTDEILNNKFDDVEDMVAKMQDAILDSEDDNADFDVDLNADTDTDTDVDADEIAKKDKTLKITVYNNKKEIKINIGDNEIDVVYENNGKNEGTTVKIPLIQDDKQIGSAEIVLIKEKNDTKLGYELTLNIEVTENGETSTYKQIAKVIFDGINNSDIVKETAKIQSEYYANGQNVKYELQYQNQNEFGAETTIGELTDENSYILNNYDGQAVSAFLLAVVNRVMEVNQNLLVEAGKADQVNPLLNTINLTPMEIMNY